MELRKRIKAYNESVKAFFSSARGRDVLLYLLFVGISFVFWVMLTLNNLIQENFRVGFRITDIPENTTLIADYPQEISVTVKNSGYALVKYFIGQKPEISVRYEDYADGKGRLMVSKQELEELMLARFGSGANVVALSPEQVSVKYTNLPGKRVPVEVAGDFTSDIQYVVNGEIKSEPDSVTVFSTSENLGLIDRIRTEELVKRSLTDTLYMRAALKRIKDVKIVPDSVSVLVPVEPLVMKTASVPVIVTDKPEDVEIVLFPAVAEVAYLVPISQYERFGSDRFEAEVSYLDVNAAADRLPVKLGAVPARYRNVRLMTDSVEYIIEH